LRARPPHRKVLAAAVGGGAKFLAQGLCESGSVAGAGTHKKGLLCLGRLRVQASPTPSLSTVTRLRGENTPGSPIPEQRLLGRTRSLSRGGRVHRYVIGRPAVCISAFSPAVTRHWGEDASTDFGRPVFAPPFRRLATIGDLVCASRGPCGDEHVPRPGTEPGRRSLRSSPFVWRLGLRARSKLGPTLAGTFPSPVHPSRG